MKKHHYLLLALAALAFASCTKDEDLGVTGGPVAARVTADIGGVQTRASAAGKWEPLDEIGITATSEKGKTNYTNVKYVVDETKPAGSFKPADESQTIYFQDMEEVGFSAYYPYMDDNTVNWYKGIFSKTITSADQTEEGQKRIDFLYAEGAVASRTNHEVKFIEEGETDARFHHRMSKLTFNFKSGDGTDIADLQNFTVNLVMDGTFNTAAGTAAAVPATTAQNKSLTISDGFEPVDENNEEVRRRTLLLFPQEVPGGTFELSLTLDGQNYRTVLSIPDNGQALLSGTSYTFGIKVHKTAVEVTGATIAEWDDGGTAEDGTATMTIIGNKTAAEAEIGDFYMKDGSLVGQDDNLDRKTASFLHRHRVLCGQT